MTEMKEDRSSDRVVGFLDISRAHLHSPARRAIYVRACKEHVDCPEGHCWRLLKAMYGLQDAGAAVDAKSETTMLKLGFQIGLFSPCLCYNQKTGWHVSGTATTSFPLVGERPCTRSSRIWARS